MKFLLTPLIMAIVAIVLSPLALAATKEITLASFSKVNVNVYGNPKSIRNRSSGSSGFVLHEDK